MLVRTLFAFVLVFIYLSSVHGADHVSYSSPGVLNATQSITTGVIPINPFANPQITIQVAFTLTNTTPDAPVLLQLYTNSSSLFNDTIVVSNETYSQNFPMCAFDGIQANENIYTKLSTNSSVNITVSTFNVFIFQTMMSQPVSANPVNCPGYRNFAFDLPKDQYSYDLQLALKDGPINYIFSRIYMKLGSCPDPEKGIWDESFAVNNSLTFNWHLQTTEERFYFTFECANLNKTPSWTMIASATARCEKVCVDAGNGCNAVNDCVCDRWKEGKNCQKVFTGIYAVAVIGGLVFLLTVSYAGWKGYQFFSARKRGYNALHEDD